MIELTTCVGDYLCFYYLYIFKLLLHDLKVALDSIVFHCESNKTLV